MLLPEMEHGFSGKTAEGKRHETSQADKERKPEVWYSGGHSVCERTFRGS